MLRDEWDLADLQVKAEKEEGSGLIKVTGCGVSAIGARGSQSLVWFMERVIRSGGTVEVTKL